MPTPGNETLRLLALGRRARSRGEALLLATVVHVEGSSYRKPGARMLLSAGGERAGTISGGCLEAEVSRKAWWLTAQGPRVEQYSSFTDDDESLPYDLGCGGRVTLLLERGPAVEATLDALELAWDAQTASVAVQRVAGGQDGLEPGTRAIVATGPAGVHLEWCDLPLPPEVLAAAGCAAAQQRTLALDNAGRVLTGADEGGLPAWFLAYIPAPPAVTIFGAGDDAQPLSAMAEMVGWRVTVADGRAHLARTERFPAAADVRTLLFASRAVQVACGAGRGTVEGEEQLAAEDIAADPFAVLMTHSFEQDRAVLRALLARPMRYIGILGPRHRTERLLSQAAPAAGLSVDEAWQRVHSPVGLNLGAHDPEGIALAITAELQAVLHGREQRWPR